VQNLNGFGVSHFIAHSDPVARIVALILIVMSIATWSVILIKAWRVWRIRRTAAATGRQFWNDARAAAGRQQRAAGHPYLRLAAAGNIAAGHYAAREAGIAADCSISDWLGAALRNAVAAELARLESGLTLLASVGSTAPFVGLFGTVWGIYHALIAVGTSGRATLDTVAGPVGEALIMTALGLAVAIPAVLGYNALVRSNRVIGAGLNAFAYELMVWLMSGGRTAPRTPTTEIETRHGQPATARAVA
jgi:biopolymer transport protein ExbB